MIAYSRKSVTLRKYLKSIAEVPLNCQTQRQSVKYAKLKIIKKYKKLEKTKYFIHGKTFK